MNIHGDVPQKAFAHNVPLPLSSIYKNYSHLLFASGCPISSVHPQLPLSDTCIPALPVVHWYTQHPSNPSPPPLETTKHVTLVGNGNVSLDIARMLLTPPDILRQYDVPSNVLALLERSAVQHVSILARRGPFDAAFTTKELRELIKLPNASMVPLQKDILEPAPGAEVSRQHKRSMQLLQKGSEQAYGTTPRTWSLDFFRSPVAHSGTELSVAHVVPVSPSNSVALTGQITQVNTDLVITSIGFKGDPQSPFYDEALGHVRTMAGRVATRSSAGDLDVVRNVYASGWAAMGAKGVLAATMMDANGVADTILSDLEKDLNPLLSLDSEGEIDPISAPPEIIAGTDVVSYGQWKRIDQAEMKRGEENGKERERLPWEEVKNFL